SDATRLSGPRPNIVSLKCIASARTSPRIAIVEKRRKRYHRHMTRLKALVFTFLMGAVLAVAQTSELDRCMDTANTQAAMNRCAGEEAVRVDAQLNLTYRQVLQAAQGDVLALAKIRNAERAWIIYRKAYMEAMYPAKDKQFNYGSIY